MSVLGIAASGLFSYLTQHPQSKNQQVGQEFQQLGQDLKAENVTAGQADYSTLEQDVQRMATHSHSHHHHGDSSSAISRLFNELGSALQSGNLSNAQQAYSSLQQDLLQLAQGSSATPAASASIFKNVGSFSVSA